MTIQEAAKVFSRLPHGLSADEILSRVEKLKRVVILKTMWYPEILDPMEVSARSYFSDLGVASKVLVIHGVPGALELPLAAQWAYESDAEMVIALGCVIRGETPHFDFVCSAVVEGLCEVSRKSGKALGMGVLTVENREQAESRLNKGYEAAQAATLMWVIERKNAE